MAPRQLKFQPTEHYNNYAQVAYEWAMKVSKARRGEPYCTFVRQACKRHLKDLTRSEKDPDYPYIFDAWSANDVCDFIEKLPHVEGQWDSESITLEPSQVFILTTIFGWRRKSDQKRRFTSVYIEMARKGAKSTLTGGVALYCLTCEGEVGPQILVGATTGEQAMKVFKPAKSMVDKTPDLREAFQLETFVRSITCNTNGGYIQTLNAKSSTQDGHNPHMGILDELHAHKDRGLYDVIKSAFGSRKNPLMWVITTAGYNVDGVCYEQRKLVAKVLEGLVEADHYFGIIFTLDEGDDPLDEKVWPKANPMLGITPTIESMRSYASEAVASPESMGEFRTKRLNVWTTAKGAWLNLEHWRRNSKVPDYDSLVEHRCTAGLDLASTSDISALVLTWIREARLNILCRFWLPEDVITERTEKANVPYKLWHEQGWLKSTPGNVTDYDFIEQDIYRLMDAYNIQQIGFDPWNATTLVNRLVENGVPMVQMRQGPKTFNAPMRELERMLKSGAVLHGDNPVLSWMASNVVARRDANDNLAPDRKNSQEKIDGIVALLMAIGCQDLAADEPSPYEDRGVLFL